MAAAAAAAAAARSFKLIIMLLLFFLARSYSLSPSCSDFIFSDGRVFESCADLPALNSYLHWTHDSSSRTLQIAYRHSHVTPSTWVAWGINPTASKSMVGTQAIVAYQKPDDGTMAVFTSPVDSYQTQLREGDLSFPVSNLSAAFFNNSEIIVFATVDMVMIPNNGSTLTHVWQDGPVLSGNTLGMHHLSGDNLISMGTLNLSSGQALPSRGPASSRNTLKIIHGALNVISWGLMMPLGFMSARYLKAVGPATDPLWFYLHIAFQLPGYIIGMAGGATGLFLLMTKSSAGIHHPCHLGIGITLLSLGLLQVSALVFRPGKDHKYRYIWNLFHHFTGYTVLVLGFVNIWSGFKILKPSKGWLIAYGIFFGGLIVSTVLLEVWKKLTRDGKKDEAALKVQVENAIAMHRIIMV